MKRVLLLFIVLLAGCSLEELEQYIPEPSGNTVLEPTILPNGTLTVHYIDIGQGDSTLIVLPNRETMLIDCGNTGKGDDIVSYFEKIGVTEIDVLIASHADADHIGGCDEIMAAFPVKKVIENGQGKDTAAYKDLVEAAKQRDYEILADDEYNLKLDPTADLDIFVPYDDYGELDEDTNENSIVAKLTYGQVSFLLTADCENRCEGALKDSEDLDADVYKVGHHGSRTSSGAAFLQEVTPSVAIISAGADNRYGHPHPEAIARIQGYTQNIFTTIDEGTIVVETNGDTLKVTNENGLLLWQDA